jgi:hypothetical protein
LERKKIVVSRGPSPQISFHRPFLYEQVAWQMLSETVSDMRKYKIREGAEVESFGRVRYTDKPSSFGLIE